jgi:hypothetical protein
MAHLVRRQDVGLQRLLNEMKAARAAHRQALGGRLDTVQIEATRAEAWAALEAYVSALHARRLPIPPPLHRDLEILRGLWAPSKRGHR